MVSFFVHNPPRFFQASFRGHAIASAASLQLFFLSTLCFFFPSPFLPMPCQISFQPFQAPPFDIFRSAGPLFVFVFVIFFYPFLYVWSPLAPPYFPSKETGRLTPFAFPVLSFHSLHTRAPFFFLLVFSPPFSFSFPSLPFSMLSLPVRPVRLPDPFLVSFIRYFFLVLPSGP